MTTQAFTLFAFPATGAPTPAGNRTMPVRLADVHNVKDFGAKGDGGTDDTTAIQAAVNWTSGADRGTIYFPLGAYKVSSPITYNYAGPINIYFRGEIGTNLFGSVNGYVFDRALGTPDYSGGQVIFEKLSIQNSHAGPGAGGIRIGSTASGIIRDCNIGAFIDITTEDSAGNSSKNICIQSCQFGTVSGSPGTSGSHGIIIGGGGTIQNCVVQSAQTAVRAYGSGLDITGCRAERCDLGFLFGVDSGNNPVGLKGFSLSATSTEGVTTGFDFGGTGLGLCEGFVLSHAGSLGHDASNSGAISGVSDSQYGLRIRADCAKSGVIQACGFGATSVWVQAGIWIDDATARTNLVIRETFSNHGGTGAGTSSWHFPGNAYTAQFIDLAPFVVGSPIWTYSQLPTGGNVQEGDEFNISDGTNGLAWGATVTNTGTHTTHYLVRWNGSVYTVVGK